MLNVDKNMLILTDGSNCKRFLQLEEDIKISTEWTEMFETKLPAYLNPNVYDYFKAQEPDMAAYSLKTLSDVAVYVHSAIYQGKKLEFEVSEDILKWSQVGADQWTYAWLAASPELW